MIVKKIFELPMLSSLLNHEPELLIRGLDISMILDGKDLSDANRHVLKAYMAEGSTIFEGENLKYLQAIKRLIRH